MNKSLWCVTKIIQYFAIFNGTHLAKHEQIQRAALPVNHIRLNTAGDINKNKTHTLLTLHMPI